ncbi:MAG: adenylate kinase family protein [Nanoarchaeota archaeon]
MRFLIIISGTPGSGKSELAKELSLLINTSLIHLSSYIKQHDLAEGYDKARKSLIVDTTLLTAHLRPDIEKARNGNKSLIVEGHLAHTLPSSLFDCCLITRCNPSVLKLRLAKRKYHAAKIQENIDCENFDLCGNEAREAGYKTFNIDTTQITPRTAAREALKQLSTLNIPQK